MSSPSRVNLVYGRRWVLANQGDSDCPPEMVDITKPGPHRSFTRGTEYRWLFLQGQGPGTLIRSDHPPQRSLKAAVPPVLEDSEALSRAHWWQLEYSDGISSASAAPPFDILSVSCRMYLAVDEAGMVVLQRSTPNMQWEAFDAEHRTSRKMRKIHGVFSRATQLAKTGLLPGRAAGRGAGYELRPLKEALSLQGPNSDAEPEEEQAAGGPSEEVQLQAFEGSIGEAFEALPDAACGGAFTPLEELMASSACEGLCDEANFLPAGCQLTVDGMFTALFGARSEFPRRYHQRRMYQRADWTTPLPLQGARWGAAGTLKCCVAGAGSSEKPYEEVRRFALSREHVVTTLGVQMAGRIGTSRQNDCRFELLLLFRQQRGSRGPGPVQLQALGLAKSQAAFQAADGCRKVFEDFHITAKQVLHETAREVAAAAALGTKHGMSAPPAAPGVVRSLEGTCFGGFKNCVCTVM